MAAGREQQHQKDQLKEWRPYQRQKETRQGMVQHWQLHKTKNYFEQLISSSKSHHAIYDGGRGLVYYLLERNAGVGTTNHQYILLLCCDNCTRNSRLNNISKIFLIKESFASKEVQVLLQLLKTLGRKFLK